MKIACAAFALLLAARFSGIAWPSTWSSARLVAALLFRGPKIVNSVSYRRQRGIRRGRRTRAIPRTDPARVRHGIAGGVGSRWQTVENRVPSWRRCCLYSQRPRPRKISCRKIMARYSGLTATRSYAGQFKFLASQFNEFGQ